jgi:hypothetical protein
VKWKECGVNFTYLILLPPPSHGVKATTNFEIAYTGGENLTTCILPDIRQMLICCNGRMNEQTSLKHTYIRKLFLK